MANKFWYMWIHLAVTEDMLGGYISNEEAALRYMWLRQFKDEAISLKQLNNSFK